MANKARLEQIRDEIKELVYEAKQLMRDEGGIAYERAKSYWVPHILGALDKENEYCGGSMINMQDSIDELPDGAGAVCEGCEDEDVDVCTKCSCCEDCCCCNEGEY